MPNDLTEQLLKLLNLPDLIIIAVVLVNMIFGFRRGFFGALSGLVGRIIALIAAYFAARAAAPYVAQWIVTPIVGDIFQNRAALSVSSGVLDGMRQTVAEAAVSMAESVAFLLLLILFCILFGWLVGLLSKSLRFIAHLTPLGILDSVAGGVVGFATGVLLIVLILLGIEFFSPITYSSLGWLSPERVSNTVLLAKLIEVLPVAI
ncbi:MAG TPA: CvpA family protein [Candidatus Agathobaculum merdigallinarum]|nr:CvpA family protein [Candidatus Agathobaculum merdigallinarum]